MSLLYIGKITTTHGLRGELKLRETINKNEVYKPDTKVYIKVNDNIEPHKIISSRPFKDGYLICFNDLNSINDVIYLKGSKVYIKREDFPKNNNFYFDTDLFSFAVIGKDDKYYGMVKKIDYVSSKKILVINNKNKDYLIPFNDVFVKKIDFDNRKVIISPIDGMF